MPRSHAPRPQLRHVPARARLARAPLVRATLVRAAVACAGLALLSACAGEDVEPPGADGVTIAIARRGHLAVVPVTLNGAGPYPFVLDTGAPESVVDSALARSLDLPVTGRAQLGSPLGSGTLSVDRVNLSAVEVAGLRLADQPAALMDLAGLLPGDDAPRGVLSYRVFDGYRVHLDLAAARVRVLPGALSPDVERVTEYAGDIPEVPVDVAGQRIAVHLDTGSPSALTLPLAAAAALPLASEPRVVGRGRTAGGEFEVYAAPLQGSVRVGPLELVNPRIGFVPGASIGNIGARLLNRLAVTLDPANRRVLLEPSTAPAAPPPGPPQGRDN